MLGSIVPVIPTQAHYAIQFAMLLVILGAVGWLLKLFMSLLDKQQKFGVEQAEKFSKAMLDHDEKTQELMTGVTTNLREFGDRVTSKMGEFEIASTRAAVLSQSMIKMLASRSKDLENVDIDRLVESVIRQVQSKG